MQKNNRMIFLITSIVLVQLLSCFSIVQAQSDEENSALETNYRSELEVPPGTYSILSENKKVSITRYESNRPNLWEGFDGQFSATFFKHFVVKINFDDLGLFSR